MRAILAYDDSAGAQTARDLLANIGLPAGSAITMATVLQQATDVFAAPGFSDVGTAEAEALLVADLQRMLIAAAAPFGARFRVDTCVLRGRPASSLVAEAESMRTDLIVSGSRGHGPFASVLLGSVSTELVDHAPCAVLVARHPKVQRLVIGVDGSDSALHAVDLVETWPFLAALPVVVTSVAANESAWASAIGPSLVGEWPVAVDDLNQEALELAEQNARTVARRLAEAGVSVTVDVRRGDAADQLVAAADSHGADLIVIGSRGLGTWSRLLIGGVAHKVVQHARQSVLVTRHVPQHASGVSDTKSDAAEDAMARV